MTEHALYVDRLDNRGRGVADFVRPDGKNIPVVVPWSLVGEHVTAQSISRTRSGELRYVAEDVSFVFSSPFRVTQRCPHFGLCGGCTWQHTAYEQQLRQKEQWIASLFPGTTLSPIIPSDSPYAYRNKMEFTFSEDRKGTHFLGLYGTYRNSRVFNLETCSLTNPWMAQTVCTVRQWWTESTLPAYRARSDEGTLQTLILREGMTSGDRMVLLTVSGNPDFAPKRHHLDSFVESIRRQATPARGELSIVLRIRQIASGRPTQFYEMILSGPDHIRETLEVEAIPGQKEQLLFHISPQAFFQPNTAQAMKVYSTALQCADLQKDDIVWDLFCGIGTFGMLAARYVRESIGVELSRESAYDAKTNGQRLQIANFRILEGDVSKMMSSMSDVPPPSVVIVDPPRSGLSPKGCEEIQRIAPQRLVYVSCNPETQAKDVLSFIKNGWEIGAIQPVDQFPQTFHVENIVLLTSKR